jgi:hypothetical protein
VRRRRDDLPVGDELRPPSPLAELPPVSGPMKPTLTLSFASAAATDSASSELASSGVITFHLMVIALSRVVCPDHRRDNRGMK